MGSASSPGYGSAVVPRGRRGLARTVLVRGLAAVVLLALLLFVPAGTLRWWQAWLFLSSLLLPAVLFAVHLLRRDPELLERRMRTREREEPQRRILRLGGVLFLAAYVLPGLDRRSGWSSVPAALSVAADAVVVAGYLLFVRVLRENRFASRVVEVEEGQQLVTSGPYALVRHPMYVSTLAVYLPSPLALGSYWGLLAAVWLVPLLVARIRNEEEVLRRNLPGYEEYARKTRFRLVPGVW